MKKFNLLNAQKDVEENSISILFRNIKKYVRKSFNPKEKCSILQNLDRQKFKGTLKSHLLFLQLSRKKNQNLNKLHRINSKKYRNGNFKVQHLEQV
jgi:hypothetical protein